MSYILLIRKCDLNLYSRIWHWAIKFGTTQHKTIDIEAVKQQLCWNSNFSKPMKLEIYVSCRHASYWSKEKKQT